MAGKTVFFFGAGATIDVVPNAPSNKDLVRKAIEDFGELPAGQNIKSFINSLFKRSNPPADNQIWNLLDYIVQQGKSPSANYNVEKISELRDNLLELIIREFKHSLNLHNVINNTYQTFVGLANALELPPSIISTNYDIFIDNALIEYKHFNYGTKLRYPFSTIARNNRYPIRGCKRPEITGQMELNTGSIKLLKIHGSLNWLYCKKCDEVDIIVGDKLDADDLRDLYCGNISCTNRYEPLLITPTMFKNYENRIIKATWDYAEKELMSAENIVFIGYALKDEDYQIRCLLMNALLSRNSEYSKIVVIERKPKDIKDEQWLKDNVESKYNDLYGKVDFRPIGFSKYIENKVLL